MLSRDFKLYLITTPTTGVVRIVGKECFDANGNVIPNTKIQEFKSVFEIENTKKEKERKVREEMKTILDGMQLEETLGLIFKYTEAKVAILTGNSNDSESNSVSITPTGEDLIVWGDRVINELETKIIELRSIYGNNYD